MTALHHRLRVAAAAAATLQRRGQLGLFVRGGAAPADLDGSAIVLIDWLRRAFAVHATGGASSGYHLTDGWGDPYPEITGYLLPTLARCAVAYKRPELHELAVIAGDWLATTRLPSGAICRKQWTPQNTSPSVFNTGQVLDGWCAMFGRDRDERWLALALDAGDWLVSDQEADGRWIRSSFNGLPHAYYTRVAWPLAVLGKLTGDDRYTRAAVRNFEWTIAQQSDNGWFNNAGFVEGEIPTTHTIAYVLEGLQEGGRVLGEPRYADAARVGARAMLDVFRQKGYLPGRLGADWNSGERWRCLTGDAQTALVWTRFGKDDGDAAFSSGAHDMAHELRRKQRIIAEWPEISGALQGSSPIWGDYDLLRYPTHGAKFMLDLLLEVRS